MPKIPLTDIPNAPQVVPQPTGGVPGSADFGHAATLLSIPQGSFDGAARGTQELARGFGNLGAVTSEIGLHIKQEQDKFDLNAAKDTMQAAFLKANEQIAATPGDPSGHGELMRSTLSSAGDGVLANDKLSRSARQSIQTYLNSFITESVGRTQVAAITTITDSNKQHFKQDYDDLIAAGKTEEAKQLCEDQRSQKMLQPWVIDGLIKGADVKGDLLAVAKDTQSDPETTRKRLENDPASYPNIPVEKRPEFINQTYTEERRQEAQSLTQISDWIENDKGVTFEQLRDAYPRAVARYAPQIKRQLAGNIDPETKKAVFSDVMERISKLDSSNAKKFSDDIADISTTMFPLDGEMKAIAGNYLTSMANKERKPSTQLMTYANKVIDNLTDSQSFGWFDKDAPKWGNPEITKWHNEVLGKNAQAKMWVAQQIPQHPEWEEADIRDKINQYVRDEHLLVPPKLPDWQADGTWHFWHTSTWGRSSSPPTSAPSQTSSVKTIKSKADYDALPAGTKFIGNDGKLYTK